ncbi:MAG: MFS transporter [Promethearchaeota archaeon]
MYESPENELDSEVTLPERLSLAKRVRLATIESGTEGMATIRNKIAIYYTSFIGLRPSVYGSAMLLYAFVNSVNDPLVGYGIDKSSHCKGVSKYKRFLLLAIPLYILGMGLLLFGQPAWKEWVLFISIFLGLSIYDTGYAITTISASSVIIQTVDADEDRGFYVGMRLSLKVIFGVAGFLLPTLFLTGNATREQALWMFIGFGVVGLLVYTLPLLTLNIPISQPKLEVQRSQLWMVMKRMLTMKSYLIYIVFAFLINGVALNQEIFLLYYADDVLEVSGTTLIVLSALSIPFLLLTNLSSKFLIQKVGLRKLSITTTIVLIASNFLTLLELSMPTSIAGLFLAVVAGNFWNVLKFPILGVSINHYEAKYGEKNEGTFLGVDAIFNSPAVSVVFFIFTVLIEQGGYISGLEGSQSFEAKNAVHLAITLISITCASIALIFVLMFPFQKKRDKEKL